MLNIDTCEECKIKIPWDKIPWDVGVIEEFKVKIHQCGCGSKHTEMKPLTKAENKMWNEPMRDVH